MPEVSIVLPSYNGKRYIRESIDSILGQTFTDWELIIVDDCSGDSTLEIACEYEKKDSRIQVLRSEKNMGLPGALNAGFEQARGKYLTWTSDDNRYLPEALEVMVECLEAGRGVMVCAAVEAIDEKGKPKWEAPLRYGEEELYRRNSIGSCFLYSRQVWEYVGKYDTELYGAEDYDYWLRIKKKFGKIDKILRVLYQYRYHENSLTATQKEKIQKALIRLRKKHLDDIIGSFNGSGEALAAFYYELMENRALDRELKERIQDMMPELKQDTVAESGEYIIFGAGAYGRKALEKLGDSAVCFADNSLDKVGKEINGKKILSFREMALISGEYSSMAAAQRGSIYQMILQLHQQGIKRYCTWQNYVWEKQQAAGK